MKPETSSTSDDEADELYRVLPNIKFGKFITEKDVEKKCLNWIRSFIFKVNVNVPLNYFEFGKLE